MMANVVEVKRWEEQLKCLALFSLEKRLKRCPCSPCLLHKRRRAGVDLFSVVTSIKTEGTEREVQIGC